MIFASAVKNQLSFNKMLETQLAKLATSVPSFDQIKNSDKPENVSSINVVTTRGGKSTRDPPHPNMAGPINVQLQAEGRAMLDN
jgi:hypothetical protein